MFIFLNDFSNQWLSKCDLRPPRLSNRSGHWLQTSGVCSKLSIIAFGLLAILPFSFSSFKMSKKRVQNIAYYLTFEHFPKDSPSNGIKYAVLYPFHCSYLRNRSDTKSCEMTCRCSRCSFAPMWNPNRKSASVKPSSCSTFRTPNAFMSSSSETCCGFNYRQGRGGWKVPKPEIVSPHSPRKWCQYPRPEVPNSDAWSEETCRRWPPLGPCAAAALWGLSCPWAIHNASRYFLN